MLLSWSRFGSMRHWSGVERVHSLTGAGAHVTVNARRLVSSRPKNVRD